MLLGGRCLLSGVVNCFVFIGFVKYGVMMMMSFVWLVVKFWFFVKVLIIGMFFIFGMLLMFCFVLFESKLVMMMLLLFGNLIVDFV